jgi:hypothetical protein
VVTCLLLLCESVPLFYICGSIYIFNAIIIKPVPSVEGLVERYMFKKGGDTKLTWYTADGDRLCLRSLSLYLLLETLYSMLSSCQGSSKGGGVSSTSNRTPLGNKPSRNEVTEQSTISHHSYALCELYTCPLSTSSHTIPPSMACFI